MSRGARLGCATAILLAVLAGFPFLFALAWSGAHCEPAPQCQRAAEAHFWPLIGTAIVGALGVGALVGLAVNKRLRYLESDSQADRFISMGWAVLVLAAIAGFAFLFHS